jgi:hypothetical protein
MGSFQAGFADLSAAVSRTTFNSIGVSTPAFDSTRLNARGSLVLGDSGLYASRSIGDGGYALVQTGIAGIGVKSGSNFTSITSKNGNAVIPVRAYTKAVISFDELAPENFDVTPLIAVAARKTGTLVKQVSLGFGAGKMLSLPVLSGVFNVDGHRYPITDRGAWVDDLAPGVYSGHIEGRDGLVEFQVSL